MSSNRRLKKLRRRLARDRVIIDLGYPEHHLAKRVVEAYFVLLEWVFVVLFYWLAYWAISRWEYALPMESLDGMV
jgi:hypothetical protein